MPYEGENEFFLDTWQIKNTVLKRVHPKIKILSFITHPHIIDQVLS